MKKLLKCTGGIFKIIIIYQFVVVGEVFFTPNPLLWAASGDGDFYSQWSGKEHWTLGERGARLACAQLSISQQDCPIQNIPRKDGRVFFSYGDLVTSGDFYNSPQELIDDRKLGVLQMLKCVHKSLKNRNPENCDSTFMLSRKEFFSVVSNNYNHFGWRNMVTYVNLHQIAIFKARKAHTLQFINPSDSEKLFREALVFNGFADHYLTDAFASGHIRVPRLAIKNWGSQKLRGGLKAQRADALSKILHDSESRNLKTGGEDGFPVQNASGEIWRTRADNNLGIEVSKSDVALNNPIQAITESFKELLQARLFGEEPIDNYRASLFVPFSLDLALTKKLSPEHQQMSQQQIVDSIYSFYPLYQRAAFPKKDFYQLLAELPHLFIEFRQMVYEDLRYNPHLLLRLPESYRQAYLEVN